MMRKLLPLLLLTLLLLLTGCAARDPIASMASTEAGAAIPAPDPAAARAVSEEATLWFRFGTEALLAPEVRTLSLSPTEPYELTLLKALTEGPAAASTELTGLFPPGVRIISTARQGRNLFVTLSRQIMNDFADEPDDWASDPEWSREVPLRRKLAMQAIAATVTENCDVDRIILLVEQGSEITDSLRLRQSYYRDGGDGNALTEPLTRDESCLLTHQKALEVILECWQMQDLPRLYRFTARMDALTGLSRPGYEEFAARMAELPPLMDYGFSGGSVSMDGRSAVFAVEMTLLEEGFPVTSVRTLRLDREKNIWRIGMSQLTAGEEDAPR